jgi:hypothetical protein
MPMVGDYLTLKEAAAWLYEHGKVRRPPCQRTMYRWLESGILVSERRAGVTHLVSVAQLERFEPRIAKRGQKK